MKPSIGVYTCVDCGKPIEVRGDQCCHDDDHLLSGHPAVERVYWAADEVEPSRHALQRIANAAELNLGFVAQRQIAQDALRRFSGEGAS